MATNIEFPYTISLPFVVNIVEPKPVHVVPLLVEYAIVLFRELLTVSLAINHPYPIVVKREIAVHIVPDVEYADLLILPLA